MDAMEKPLACFVNLQVGVFIWIAEIMKIKESVRVCVCL